MSAKLADRLEDLEWVMHPGMGGMINREHILERLGVSRSAFERQLWRHGLGKLAVLFSERDHVQLPGSAGRDKGSKQHWEPLYGDLPWRIVRKPLREALTALGREPNEWLAYEHL
jgi:hypothetical protein